MNVPGLAEPLRYRLAAYPLVGYPLLLCWLKGWLPAPLADAQVRLKDGRLLQFRLSDRTQRTMWLGLFEPSETRLVCGLLQPGDVFVDVGAHVGWFTTVAARRVGSRGQVIACEPYPENAAALRENLALNGMHDVRVIEAALSDRPGTLRLRKGSDSGGVTALEWCAGGEAEVPMTTLDETTSAIVAIKLVKIDVEGWEAHVLRGAAETLKRTANVLIEINQPALEEAASSADELIGFLRDAGFTSFVTVGQTGLRRLHSDDRVVNVLASRAVAGQFAGDDAGAGELTKRFARRVSFRAQSSAPLNRGRISVTGHQNAAVGPQYSYYTHTVPNTHAELRATSATDVRAARASASRQGSP